MITEGDGGTDHFMPGDPSQTVNCVMPVFLYERYLFQGWKSKSLLSSIVLASGVITDCPCERMRWNFSKDREIHGGRNVWSTARRWKKN